MLKSLKSKFIATDLNGETNIWHRIYSRLLPYWKIVIVAVLLVSIVSATKPLLAVIMKPLLDDGFTGTKPYYIWLLPLSVVGIMFFRGLAAYASSYLLALVANNMLRNLRTEMFQSLITLPDSRFKQGDTGRLLNRFTIDAGTLTTEATEVITVLVREILTVIALIAVLFYMSWQLTLIVFFMLPLSYITARIISKRLRKINRGALDMNAELTRVVGESIEGQRVVKLFDGYEHESGRFQYVNAKIRRYAMRAASASAALSPITQFFISISVAVVITVALYQASANDLTVGGFAAFMAALVQLFDPIRRLANMSSTVQKMLAAAESVFALLGFESEIDTGTKQLPTPIQGKVEFRNVEHRYPNKETPTIKNVSFSILPGQTVALVGKSGSGKTTLANMLPRFLAPYAGGIYLDDTLISDITLHSLRSNLSFVSQDVVLFEGSIKDNVAYGAYAKASDEEVWAALESANLTEFIHSLPEGMHTQVGEKAGHLSGGQRQRLAIARALIKNAPILILDEATSALDNESERQVQLSLERLMKSRSTLVIAHRLSTVQKADCIIVLDEGEIAESGTHDELLALNGIYANLYHMQFETVQSKAE